MEELDSLERRKRTVPQSTGKRVTQQPRDMMWFEKLREHGPLPSSFLLAFCKNTHRSEKRAQERLTDLFNENHTPHKGNYLSRPPKQFATIDSRYNQLVYDLTKASRKALSEADGMDAPSHINAGPWVHRLMVSCITASIELACSERDDVNFIPGSQILARAETELRFPTEIMPPDNAHPIKKDLLPDAVFGLEYLNGDDRKYRFFALEADRSTEPAETANFNRKSFVRSLLQYQAYVEGRGYRKHLGLTAPMIVLHVTCDENRLAKMVEVTGKHFPTGNSYMLFQSWTDFGPIFKPPSPNFDLLDGIWKRAGMESFEIWTA